MKRRLAASIPQRRIHPERSAGPYPGLARSGGPEAMQSRPAVSFHSLRSVEMTDRTVRG